MFEIGSKNRSIDAIRIRKALWSNLLWLVWAMWWGGLSFYAMVVVPIGTMQIGAVEQGFVTQQVTWWHNALCGAFTVILMLEVYYRKSRLLYATAFLLAFISILLMAGHIYLTKQMNFQDRSVGRDFYSQHAIYLWVTAAEWTVGLLIPFILIYATRKSPNVSGESLQIR